MRLYVVIGACCMLFLFSMGCEVLPEVRPIPATVYGMSPIYIDSVDGKTISTSGPMAIIEGRAFAIRGDTLYIVDQLRGIHILDNSMPAEPVSVSFISIPGCTSVAINGNFLYVNNLSDLVTIDVSDPLNAVVVDREADLYPLPLDFPEGYLGFYECYEPALGYLTGWKPQDIELPECYIE